MTDRIWALIEVSNFRARSKYVANHHDSGGLACKLAIAMDVQLGTYLCYQPQGTFPSIDASLKTRLFTSHLSPKSANNGFEIEAKKGRFIMHASHPLLLLWKQKRSSYITSTFKVLLEGPPSFVDWRFKRVIRRAWLSKSCRFIWLKKICQLSRRPVKKWPFLS